MKNNDAWDRFMKSGNIQDYLDYRREIEGSSDILDPTKGGVFGADNENSDKWYRNPRGGIWGKR